MVSLVLCEGQSEDTWAPCGMAPVAIWRVQNLIMVVALFCVPFEVMSMVADPMTVILLTVHVYTSSSLLVTNGNTKVGVVSSLSSVSRCHQLNRNSVLEVPSTIQVKTR